MRTNYCYDDSDSLEYQLIGILLNKIRSKLYLFNNSITLKEISKALNVTKFDISNYSELNSILKLLEYKGILSENMLFSTRSGDFLRLSGPLDNLKEFKDNIELDLYEDKTYYINIDMLKQELANNIDDFKELGIDRSALTELDSKKNNIKAKLNKLKKMIKDKKSEREIHKFIDKNNLLPNLSVDDEKTLGSQNRLDFILKNEYDEYEIWELKSPSDKLFKVSKRIKLTNKSEYFNNLKQINKSVKLNCAIEQILVYKKWLLENINNSHEHGLDNNVYNAKLIIVIGTDEEFNQSELLFDKLNLERHSYHNLNIITYDMLYKKIEQYYLEFIK